MPPLSRFLNTASRLYLVYDIGKRVNRTPAFMLKRLTTNLLPRSYRSTTFLTGRPSPALGQALALIKLARHVQAEKLLKGLDPEVKLTPEQEAVRTEVAGAVKKALGE